MGFLCGYIWVFFGGFFIANPAFISLTIVVDRHRVDADPDQTFHFWCRSGPPTPSLTQVGKSAIFSINSGTSFSFLVIVVGVKIFSILGSTLKFYEKKVLFSVTFGWNGYGSGSAKMMPIWSNPQLQGGTTRSEKEPLVVTRIFREILTLFDNLHCTVSCQHM